ALYRLCVLLLLLLIARAISRGRTLLLLLATQVRRMCHQCRHNGHATVGERGVAGKLERVDLQRCIVDRVLLLQRVTRHAVGLAQEIATILIADAREIEHGCAATGLLLLLWIIVIGRSVVLVRCRIISALLRFGCGSTTGRGAGTL